MKFKVLYKPMKIRGLFVYDNTHLGGLLHQIDAHAQTSKAIQLKVEIMVPSLNLYINLYS